MKLFGKKTIEPDMVFEGKYIVKKKLGHGGMGDVWLVRHDEMKKDLALKVLNPKVARKKSGKIIERFFREAQLAARIQHPNLITVHDVGKSRKTGYYYIIMDYVPGGSLRDLLKKEKRIPPDRALQIIRQMASALCAADANHMVHRDIKPDNIMFDADGTAKLADLGIAKSTDEQDPGLTMEDPPGQGGSRPRPQFGTPAYMSPEQAHDSSQVDIRADIYSLGVVFYEMLTGRQPFYGSTCKIILSQVMGPQPVPSISLVAPDIPQDLAALISEMTEKKLDKRIPNPNVLLQRLNAIHLPAQIRMPSFAQLRPGGSCETGATEIMSSEIHAGSTNVTRSTEVIIGDTNVTGSTEVAVEPAPQPASAPAQPESVPEPPEVPNVTLATKIDDTPDSEPAPQPAPQPVAAQPAPQSAPQPAVSQPAASQLKPAPRPKAAAQSVSPAPAKQKEEDQDHSEKPPKRKSRVLLIVMAFLLLFIFGSVSVLVVRDSLRKKESPEQPVEPKENVNTPDRNQVGKDKPEDIDPPPGPQPKDPDEPKEDDDGKNDQIIDLPNKSAVEVGGPVVPPIETEPLEPDPLGMHQIVLLADESDYVRTAKKALTQEFGAENVSWQEAAGMGGYIKQIEKIIKSDPSVVILCFSEDFITEINKYDNFIHYHADEYHSAGIPFVFIMMPAGEDDVRMQAINTSIHDESQHYSSVPFAGDMLSSDSFPAMIREVRKK